MRFMYDCAFIGGVEQAITCGRLRRRLVGNCRTGNRLHLSHYMYLNLGLKNPSSVVFVAIMEPR